MLSELKLLLISIFIILFELSLQAQLSAQEQIQPDSLFEMSLAELMNVKVDIGTLTGMELSKVPAPVTTITEEDIMNSPARNILDLIEVYVPGVMIRNYYAGAQTLKIRGLGERNYKTILLVNGRPVNQKGLNGSTVEITNWDLNDIERIEVIRGPGSVIYGPGAISGIINIVTKQTGSLDGFKTGVEYNEGYNSKGAFLQYGFNKEKFKLFTNISIRYTDGYKDPKYFQSLNNGEIGYKGDTNTFSGRDGYPTQSYYQDYDHKPQIKAHLELTYLDAWRFWTRYTSSGQALGGGTKRQFEGKSKWEDSFGWRDESFISAIENTYKFSDAFSLKSILSFDSENFFLANNLKTQYSSTDIRQRSYSFAENEIFVRSILNYEPSEKLKAAIGLEYSYDWLGDNWGKPNSFHGRAGKMNFFSINALYNDIYDSTKIEEYNSGWSAQTYSLMGEFSYEFLPQLEVLISGRIDKNTYTDYMFSPRVAIISEIDDRNIVKAIWQRSFRMNTMMELYYMDLNNINAEPEALTTYQLIYNRLQNKNLAFQVSAYYYDAEVLAWSGTNVIKIGEQKSLGAEIEVKYKTNDNKGLFGINHSYSHLLDWEDYLKNTVGSKNQRISLSDFYYQKGFLEFTSTGNSLIYWADNITKFYARVKFLDNWTFHIDSRIAWEYTYLKDLMEMYKKAYNNVNVSTLSPEDLEKYNKNRALLAKYEKEFDDKDAFGLHWTFDASLTWNIPYFKKHKTSLTLYGQNIFAYGNNNPYEFYVSELPVISWQEEPRTFGFKLSIEF